MNLAVGEHRLGKGEQQCHRQKRAERADQKRIPHHADVRLVDMCELLGEAALEAERRELGRELDHQHGISEPPKRLGAVHPAGDEQERQARDQPQHEAKEIDPAAAREVGHVGPERRHSSAVGT